MDEFDNDDALVENWDDDEPLIDGDDWEAEEEPKPEPPKPKKPEPPVKKSKVLKSAVAKRIDEADPALRKKLLREAELEADLNNAADLFDGLGVADEHPRAKALRKEQEAAALKAQSPLTVDLPITDHPIFEPETKADYERLKKALVPVFQQLAEKSLINYSSALAIDLIREIAKPLSVENMRKVESTLKVAIRDKERAERQARLAKSGGTASGGAGKKKAKGKVNLGGSMKKDDMMDMTNYDDFGDDDFM